MLKKNLEVDLKEKTILTRRQEKPRITGRILLAAIPAVLAVVLFLYVDQTLIVLAAVSAPLFIFYPILEKIIKRSRVASRIKSDFPTFLLYISALSTSLASRKNFFKLVASKEEYRDAAKAFKRLSVLSEQWRYGNAKASKIVAQETPEPSFKEFLMRLSQAISIGQPLDSFFKAEYETFLLSFSSKYERVMETLKLFNDAYSSLITSIAFVSVTMLLSSMLYGLTAPEITLSITAMLTCSATLSMVLLFYFVTPSQPLVHIMEHRPKKLAFFQRIFKPLLIVTVSLVIVSVTYRLLEGIQGNCTFSAEFWNVFFPVPLSFILSGSVMFFAGFSGKKYLKKVRALEDQYPAFIRSLGASIATVGALSAKAVENILTNDYGKLTSYIRRLHKRLNLRMNPKICWKLFEAETGSESIRRYTEIFTDVISVGGDPEEVSLFVSKTCIQFGILKKRRKQLTDSLRGLLIPLHIVLIAILAMGQSLATLLSEFLSKIQSFIGLWNVIPLPLLDIFSFLILLAMSIGNALILHLLDGEANFNLLYYLGVFFLITGLVYFFVYWGCSAFMGTFAGFGSNVTVF